MEKFDKTRPDIGVVLSPMIVVALLCFGDNVVHEM